MKEKDLFIASCGVDENGDGKSIAMIETMFISMDPETEPRSIDTIAFDGVPVNIFRTTRFTMVDLIFRDNTDYDFVK